MSEHTQLRVIVPCYNPPEGWETALAGRFLDFCNQMPLPPEAIGLTVVNDGSARNATAESFSRLRSLIQRVQIVDYRENRGKGYALRQGVSASSADCYLVTDADFPYTLESMRRVAETALKQGGIAAGNRDTRYYAHVPFFRRLLSKGLRWMLRHFLRQPISDSQCGLKAFDAQGKKVFLETGIDRFLFDLEFLMLAHGRVAVQPVPVELREGVVFSKVGKKVLMTEAGNFLKLLFSIR